MKTVLIAGGAGFLGSWLCDSLIASGCRVICLDNLQTGAHENIAHLRSNPNFRFLRHDVIDEIVISENIDEIYNLACAASPPRYQADPIHTFKTNIWGSMNLLELARLHDAKILQASTSEVYGDPEVSVQSESYFGNVNTFGPRSCYDEGKRAAETLFHDFHHQHGVKAKIVRIFNTYGPRMDINDGRVVSNFIVQALRGDAITVYGNGEQTRSFCYCDDLIAGLLALMATDDDVTGPVNIGNPIEITMLELAQHVIQLTGSRSSLVYRELPQDDPKKRRPDISLAAKALGWQPKVGLAEGLESTITYFRGKLVEELQTRCVEAAE
ncbi:MAG: NAD-dependent epimerase/dehydratase family protein [Rhodobacteraceae bacterium]|nr:NAD-dependent epimerase/dehydratase family protein [Paracoccaceae bacterium]